MSIIDKILFHFPWMTQQSVYDTEELTALELAAKTAGVVNQCVEQVNTNTNDVGSMRTELTEYEQSLTAGNTAFKNQVISDNAAFKSDVILNLLPVEVREKIDEMEDDGTLATIINQEIFADLSGYGTLAQLPTTGLYPGFRYFATDIAQTVYYTGTKWVRADGTPAKKVKITDGGLYSSSALYSRKVYTGGTIKTQNIPGGLANDLVQYMKFKMADNNDYCSVQLSVDAAMKMSVSFGYDWATSTADGKTLSIIDLVNSEKTVIVVDDFFSAAKEFIMWYDKKWGYLNFYINDKLVGSWKPAAGGTVLADINKVTFGCGSGITSIAVDYHYMGTPLIASIGDSIMCGSDFHAPNPDMYVGVDLYDNSFPAKVAAYLKGLGIRNYFIASKAVNGETAATMLARFNDVIASGCKYALIHGGNNDFPENNPSATALYKKNMADAATAATITPVILGITPVAPGHVAAEYDIAMHNYEQGGTYANYNYIELWPALNFAATPDYADTSLLNDTIHPNNTGTGRLAKQINKYLE